MSEYTLISAMNQIPHGSYYIIKPAHPYIGLCGYFWQVIRGIFKYPNQKYYIYIGPNDSMNGGGNVWEYYFKQPYTPGDGDTPIATVGLLFDEESEFVDVYPCMKKLTPEQLAERRQTFTNITKKYFVLNPSIQSKIDEFKAQNFTGKRVLGFHCRATDHPDKQDISITFNELDKLVNEYDIIFSSSDEKAFIETLKSRYGDKIVTYNSKTRSDHCDFQMTRSENTQGTHAFRYNALVNWSKQNEGYQIGEDIVVETHLMASTDFLLCAINSNVNYFIRALNNNLPYKIIHVPNL